MDGFFDTHTHYDHAVFDGDRDSLIEHLKQNGVCGIVNQGQDFATSLSGIVLAQKHKGVYCAVGLHPQMVNDTTAAELEDILALAVYPEVRAIGEIGLDYCCDVPRSLQKQVFVREMEAAAGLGLPVNIHDRGAHGDMLALLRQYRPKGILHGFSGSAEMAREIVKLGMYIGIGGAATYYNARKIIEVIRTVPMEHLVLETDCPFLAPEPLERKARNHSGNLLYIAEKTAAVKGISVREVADITRKNAEAVYNILQ